MFINALNYKILPSGRKGNKCVVRVEVFKELEICEVIIWKCDIVIIRSNKVRSWVLDFDKREVQERIGIAM